MTEPGRRICIIAPSLQLGGLENSVAVMTNHLATRGHRVGLVLCYRAVQFYTLEPSVTVFEPPFHKQSMVKSLFYCRWMQFVRRSVQHFDADAVLSYGDFHNSLVLAALSFSGRPVVISDRASPDLYFPPLARLLRQLTYRRAVGIIAQTRRAADVKRRMTGARVPVHIIPNPVRTFSASDGVNREKIVLAVARHYHVKGLDRLIEAFYRFRNGDWRLEIAGSEGPETPVLQALIESRGLADRVQFLGAVKEIGAVYARASIFVLPSRSEGFPNALIEAMAHGCASISFDICAGPSDIIHSGKNGFLVPDGDVDTMAACMKRLALDDELRQRIAKEAMEISADLALERVGAMVERVLLSTQTKSERG